MKKDDLEKEKATILEEIRILDIETSKVVRDEGFIPFLMRSNKVKLMNKLEEVADKISKLKAKPVVKPVTKSKQIKQVKKVDKDE